MSGPVQHHYLPKAAYLTFFQVPAKPGFIWLYQRGGHPTLVSIDKVGKERHLYSFPTEDEEHNTDIETLLARLEYDAAPILAQLNSASGTVTITAEQEAVLAEFAAFQAQRTPAMRREIAELCSGASRAFFQADVAHQEAFRQRFEELKLSGNVPMHGDADRVRQIILDGDYEIVTDPKFAMAIALETAVELIPTFLMKRLTVLRSADECFITGDYPILKISAPQRGPIRGSGFINSHVLLPIGRQTALLWHLEPSKRPSKDPDAPIKISSQGMSSAAVRRVGKAVMAAAERFVFASENNPAVQRLLNATERPVRMEADWSALSSAAQPDS